MNTPRTELTLRMSVSGPCVFAFESDDGWIVLRCLRREASGEWREKEIHLAPYELARVAATFIPQPRMAVEYAKP